MFVDDGTQGLDGLTGLREAPVVVPRIGLVRKNEMGVVVEVDEATVQMLGWSRDELVGKPSYEIVHPEDQVRAEPSPA